MADNYAVKGAMKGLMAGLRGVVEGKLAIKQAQTAKARKEAEINLDNKRFNMEQAKQNFDLQTQLANRGREAIKFENEQADLKAEQERKEQLHEQQQGIRERLKTADDRYDELFKKSLAATNPEEQESIQVEMEHLKRDRAYLIERLGEGSSSLEAEIKSESDEAAAVAEHTRTLEIDKIKSESDEAAAVAEHERTLETETKEKEAAAVIQAELTTKLDKFKEDLDVWEPW